ncbi:MAG: flagellar motor stator protein MotA [Planctomycetaceae bacterium]
MLVVVGMMIVIGSVIGGFTMAGGHVGALIHPSEIVTIGGAAFGAMVIMSPISVLKALMAGIIKSLKGNPYGREAYLDLFKLLYQLLNKARRDGMLALESHVSDPHASTIFQRYPSIAHNHHVCEFIAGSMRPMLDGSVTGEQLEILLEQEISAGEREHHQPIDVLGKTADGLPGFGIVAAVLGIVVTMEHIDGPVEEIGHKVGAALVGTFLGILMSYGFLAPLVVKLEMMGAAETDFLRAIATTINSYLAKMPPKVAVDAARRGLPSEIRPSGDELEKLLKEVDSLND